MEMQLTFSEVCLQYRILLPKIIVLCGCGVLLKLY